MNMVFAQRPLTNSILELFWVAVPEKVLLSYQLGKISLSPTTAMMYQAVLVNEPHI